MGLDLWCTGSARTLDACAIRLEVLILAGEALSIRFHDLLIGFIVGQRSSFLTMRAEAAVTLVLSSWRQVTDSIDGSPHLNFHAFLLACLGFRLWSISAYIRYVHNRFAWSDMHSKQQ